jgi:NADH-quinone oxidoreductase subunit J
MTIDMILVIALVVAALWTVMTARLLRSAIGLAVTSAILAVIMFRLVSPLAAVFELSVCAGLIPAIFISAIGLTRRLGPEDVKARVKERLKRYWFLPILVVGVAVVLSQLPLPIGLALPVVTETGDVRAVLWNLRHIDLLGQIVVLLGGAFAVVVLLKELKNER